MNNFKVSLLWFEKMVSNNKVLSTWKLPLQWNTLKLKFNFDFRRTNFCWSSQQKRRNFSSYTHLMMLSALPNISYSMMNTNDWLGLHKCLMWKFDFFSLFLLNRKNCGCFKGRARYFIRWCLTRRPSPLLELILSYRKGSERKIFGLEIQIFFIEKRTPH